MPNRLPNRLPNTRHSLLLRLTDTDNHAAWREFTEVYEAAIYRYAMSRGLQPADAEDVTQQVLSAAIKKAEAWDPNTRKGSFSAWLICVTHNQSAKAWNEQQKRVTAKGGSTQQLLINEAKDPTQEECTRFDLEYRRALFHWAAQRVRQDVHHQTWSAFWQTAVEEQKPQSVADALGVSLATVYTNKCRMLQRVQKEIRRFEDVFAAMNPSGQEGQP